jgi:hypothetical protein
MREYDPASEMEHLKAIYGVPRVLAKDFEECRDNGVLAWNAEAILNCAVRCVIAGYGAVVEELLLMCERFAAGAIEANELSAEDQACELGSTYLNLALCRWLTKGVHDEESFHKMVDLYDAHLKDERNKIEWLDLDLTLQEYVAAGAYLRAIALFERAGLKSPEAPKKARRPAAAAYILSQHRLDQRFDEIDIRSMLSRLFKSHVSTHWLGKGHNAMVVVWMKAAFWTPGVSAIETVLRCYDYMPQYTRPLIGPNT